MDDLSQNLLLGSLSRSDKMLLTPHLLPHPLVLHQVVVKADRAIKHVLFPKSGICSVVARSHRISAEVGLVGREGVIGVPAILGVEESPEECIVQASGEALRLPVETLQELAERSSSLRTVLLQYAQVLMAQTQQTALANASSNIEARLSRWILMTHDRNDSDEVALTHEQLSRMLAYRRPSVTKALHMLEGVKAIKARRGSVRILDRMKLLAFAGDTYGIPESIYEKLFRRSEEIARVHDGNESEGQLALASARYSSR